MKLLFDQNLSPRLVALLSAEFPGSFHVRDLGMAKSSDSVLWAYAAAKGFGIVSKDADFQHRALLRSHPPKVIWIRLGNCSTAAVAALLRIRLSEILTFDADPSESFLALS